MVSRPDLNVAEVYCIVVTILVTHKPSFTFYQMPTTKVVDLFFRKATGQRRGRIPYHIYRTHIIVTPIKVVIRYKLLILPSINSPLKDYVLQLLQFARSIYIVQRSHSGSSQIYVGEPYIWHGIDSYHYVKNTQRHSRVTSRPVFDLASIQARPTNTCLSNADIDSRNVNLVYNDSANAI